MSLYADCQKASDARRERADCVVVALAICAGIPYETAHEICAGKGRKKRAGMNVRKWLPMFRKHTQLKKSEFLSSFKTSTTLTRRLKRESDANVYLVQFTKHVAVWKSGEWQDWITGKSLKRVKAVWRIYATGVHNYTAGHCTINPVSACPVCRPDNPVD